MSVNIKLKEEEVLSLKKPKENTQENLELNKQKKQFIQYRSVMNQQKNTIVQQEKQIQNVWLRNPILIMMYVRKFINIITSNSRSYRFQKLTKQQMSAIDDQTTNYQYFFYNNYFQIVSEKLKKQQKKDKFLFTFYQKPSLLMRFKWWYQNLQSKQTILLVILMNDKNILSIFLLLFCWWTVCQRGSEQSGHVQDKTHLFQRTKTYFKQPQQIFDVKKTEKLLKNFILENIVIIQPNSALKISWDIWVLFLLVINFIYIPLKLSFLREDTIQNISEVLYQFLDQVAGHSFLMCFSTLTLLILTRGYWSLIGEGLSLIILKNFFWDMIIVVPFFVNLYYRVPYLEGTLLLTLGKINYIIEEMVEIANLNEKNSGIFKFVKLVLTIIYIAHFCCCGFYFLSKFQESKYNNSYIVTAVSKQIFSKEDIFAQYIYSLYWAVITMITVGYGDIVPVTTNEKIFVICICMLACGVFAYSINSIGIIIQEMRKGETQYRLKMSALSNHMKKRGLSTQLQIQVQRYYQYLFTQYSDDNHKGEEMINALSEELRKEVFTDIYLKTLEGKKFFQIHFSQKLLENLSLRIKEIRLLPDEIVFKENDVNRNIFMVSKGELNVLFRKNNSEQYTIIQTLKKGDYFNQYEFLSGDLQIMSCKTITCCTLLSLSYEDFILDVKRFPNDFEKFSLLRDRVLEYGDILELDCKCYACGQYNHIVQQCPILTYTVPDVRKQKLIWNYNHNTNEERDKKKQRKLIKRPKTLLLMDNVREQVLTFNLDHNPLNEDNQELVERVTDVINKQQLIQIDIDETLFDNQNLDIEPKDGPFSAQKENISTALSPKSKITSIFSSSQNVSIPRLFINFNSEKVSEEQEQLDHDQPTKRANDSPNKHHNYHSNIEARESREIQQKYIQGIISPKNASLNSSIEKSQPPSKNSSSNNLFQQLNESQKLQMQLDASRRVNSGINSQIQSGGEGDIRDDLEDICSERDPIQSKYLRPFETNPNTRAPGYIFRNSTSTHKDTPRFFNRMKEKQKTRITIQDGQILQVEENVTHLNHGRESWAQDQFKTSSLLGLGKFQEVLGIQAPVVSPKQNPSIHNISGNVVGEHKSYRALNSTQLQKDKFLIPSQSFAYDEVIVFDKLPQFKYYFPKYNYANVMKDNKYLQKKTLLGKTLIFKKLDENHHHHHTPLQSNREQNQKTSKFFVKQNIEHQ